MKAIVIYTEDWCNYEFCGTIIHNVIAIDDNDLSKIDIDDILHGEQKYEILDLQQARIETKNVLRWGE